MLSKGEVIDILQLMGSANLGPATFHKLIEEHGSPQKAIEGIKKDTSLQEI